MRLPGRYDGVARPIVTYGSNPVLHRRCADVTSFDRDLRHLVLDMFASMQAADGVGLAANQIGVDAQVFVIDCPDAEGNDVVGYVVNPKLTVLEPWAGEPEIERTEEGCLSVPRPLRRARPRLPARVDGVDVHGDPTSIEATGMAARCLQHECDHLEGTVYVDRLPPSSASSCWPRPPDRRGTSPRDRRRGHRRRRVGRVVAPVPRRRRAADVLVGSPRQLDLVPVDAERRPWPSPLVPAVPGLFAPSSPAARSSSWPRRPDALGRGDDAGAGAGRRAVRVLPAPSSVSLACARLGWAVEDTQVVSLVGRPLELLHPHVHPGRRLLVLGSDGGTPAAVAGLLTARGYGASVVTALASLGGPDETITHGTAADWGAQPQPLVVTAVECRAASGTAPMPTTPGLPDDAYEHDGQLTKNEVRAVTLARLAPVPGQLLWDIGAGSGSIGIEWMRAPPRLPRGRRRGGRERAERIARNASRLGVPYLRVVHGSAPEVFGRLPQPDAVFVGGGATTPLLLDACWDALPPGGRMVVNAVTVQSEAVLADWQSRFGGALVRLAVQRAEPVGGFLGWKPAMPVTIWSGTR